MESWLIGLIILIVISSLLLNYNYFQPDKTIIPTEKNPKFSSCRRLTSKQLITQVLNQNQFSQDDQDWHLHITCKDDYTNQQINQLRIKDQDQRIMGVSGKWTLGSKINLWKILLVHFGRSRASELMPDTYLLNNPVELKLLRSKLLSKNRLTKKEKLPYYFLKKDIERQKGLALTNDSKVIQQAKENGYVVAQQFLDSPYLYQGHKINLRVYLLLVCSGDGHQQAYLHQDGIISYTGLPYRSPISDGNNSVVNLDRTVASFYQSEQLYNQGFPIVWSKFRQDLPHQGQKVQAQVEKLLSQVMDAAHHSMCQYRFRYQNVSFELFGVDIFLDQMLHPWLIEINVGPGMSPHDQRDQIMRSQVYQDMFSVVGLIPYEDKNQFNMIWNI